MNIASKPSGKGYFVNSVGRSSAFFLSWGSCYTSDLANGLLLKPQTSELNFKWPTLIGVKLFVYNQASWRPTCKWSTRVIFSMLLVQGRSPHSPFSCCCCFCFVSFSDWTCLRLCGPVFYLEQYHAESNRGLPRTTETRPIHSGECTLWTLVLGTRLWPLKATLLFSYIFKVLVFCLSVR